MSFHIERFDHPDASRRFHTALLERGFTVATGLDDLDATEQAFIRNDNGQNGVTTFTINPNDAHRRNLPKAAGAARRYATAGTPPPKKKAAKRTAKKAAKKVATNRPRSGHKPATPSPAPAVQEDGITRAIEILTADVARLEDDLERTKAALEAVRELERGRLGLGVAE